jgi:hypothetical protein
LGIVTARQLEITWKNIRQNGGAIPLIHRFFLKFSQFKWAQQSIAA